MTDKKEKNISIANISYGEMEKVNFKRMEDIMFYMQKQGMTRAELETIVNNMDFAEELVNYNFGAVTSPEVQADRRAVARAVMGLPAEDTKE